MCLGLTCKPFRVVLSSELTWRGITTALTRTDLGSTLSQPARATIGEWRTNGIDCGQTLDSFVHVVTTDERLIRLWGGIWCYTSFIYLFTVNNFRFYLHTTPGDTSLRCREERLAIVTGTLPTKGRGRDGLNTPLVTTLLLRCLLKSPSFNIYILNK